LGGGLALFPHYDNITHSPRQISRHFPVFYTSGHGVIMEYTLSMLDKKRLLS